MSGLNKKKVTFENLNELHYDSRESFNALRTNIQFCGDQFKVISFTSCLENEGKSNIVFTVARSMAANGKKVLIVDADIRKSVLVSRYMVKEKTKGLSEYLSGQCKKDEIVYETNVDNLDLVFTGPSVPNPSELLGNRRMEELLAEAREVYDYVFVDLPPLGQVIDAAVVAAISDGAILVIQNAAISYKIARTVKNQLLNSGVKILGAVLNKVDFSGKSKYGSYSKYKRYGKYSRYGKYRSYGDYGLVPKKEEK